MRLLTKTLPLSSTSPPVLSCPALLLTPLSPPPRPTQQPKPKGARKPSGPHQAVPSATPPHALKHPLPQLPTSLMRSRRSRVHCSAVMESTLKENGDRRGWLTVVAVPSFRLYFSIPNKDAPCKKLYPQPLSILFKRTKNFFVNLYFLL